jgi:hypothetical protein
MKDKFALLSVGLIGVALLYTFLLTRATGSLTVATPGVELQLKGGFGSGMVLRCGEEAHVVPARTYRPTTLLVKLDQNGDTWQLQSHGPWGHLGHIKVEKNRTTALELGPPLRIDPHVGIYPGQVRVTLRLVGRAGEMYQNTILKNNQRVAAPNVRIVDEAGMLLASGAFQYG